jgi:hypothetical protein
MGSNKNPIDGIYRVFLRFKPVQTRVLEAVAELSEAKWLALTL